MVSNDVDGRPGRAARPGDPDSPSTEPRTNVGDGVLIEISPAMSSAARPRISATSSRAIRRDGVVVEDDGTDSSATGNRVQGNQIGFNERVGVGLPDPQPRGWRAHLVVGEPRRSHQRRGEQHHHRRRPQWRSDHLRGRSGRRSRPPISSRGTTSVPSRGPTSSGKWPEVNILSGAVELIRSAARRSPRRT